MWIGLIANSAEAAWVDVWMTVVSGQFDNVKHWGTLNLRQPMLAALSEVRAPFVNELDVRDCETLPTEYLSFASSKGIQLWASGGGFGFGTFIRGRSSSNLADPLPSAELHNLLQEFQPKLADILPKSAAQSISALISPSQNGVHYDDNQKPAVQVCSVLSVSTYDQKSAH
jgi:hypothetical protein